MLKKIFIPAMVAAFFSSIAAVSNANTVAVYAVNSNNAGEPVIATAVFTFSAGHLTIDLTNNVNNPHAAGSLLGGVMFTLAGGPFGNPTNLAVTGPLVDISSGSPVAYAGNTATELAHWQFTSFSPDTLRVAGNDPLIIGYGNGGLASSPYSNANSSLTGSSHNPFIQGTAHFDMNIAGLSANGSLSSVTMLFGTNYCSFTATPQGGGSPTPTPLPAAAWAGMSLIGALGLGSKARKMLRRA